MKKYCLLLVMAGVWVAIFLNNCVGTPATPSPDPKSAADQAEVQSMDQQSTQEGVYVGMLSFADRVVDLTNGKVLYLSEQGRDTLLNTITNYKRAAGSGTSLYYAVHQAIVNLSNNASQFSKNLSSINLIIFTDGLDNNSTSLALPMVGDQDFRGKSREAYQTYVRDQLANQLIADTPITSIVTGVMGTDVDDRNAFAASLASLANNPNKSTENKNYYELTNFTELNQQFQNIANNLTVINRALDFTIITPSYQPGTKIRMTFDVVDNSPQAFARSTRYLEGEVGVNNANYELTKIAYSQGVSSSAGTVVSGTLKGTEVSYEFPNLVATNVKWENIKQWSLDPGTSRWQRNSEYTIGDSLKIVVEKRSAIVYLVLDNSRSMSEDDIDSIRNTIENFINLLYLKANDDGGTAGGQTITTLHINNWKDDQLTSGQSRYYRFHARPGDYVIRWNDANQGDGTKTCDILVTAYREDTGESLFFEKDSAYREPIKVSIPIEMDVLLEVEPYSVGQGTYSIMYQAARR